MRTKCGVSWSPSPEAMADEGIADAVRRHVTKTMLRMGAVIWPSVTIKEDAYPDSPRRTSVVRFEVAHG